MGIDSYFYPIISLPWSRSMRRLALMTRTGGVAHLLFRELAWWIVWLSADELKSLGVDESLTLSAENFLAEVSTSLGFSPTDFSGQGSCLSSVLHGCGTSACYPSFWHEFEISYVSWGTRDTSSSLGWRKLLISELLFDKRQLLSLDSSTCMIKLANYALALTFFSYFISLRNIDLKLFTRSYYWSALELG